MDEARRVALGSELGPDEKNYLAFQEAKDNHNDIAEHWDSWSALLGRGALAILEEVADSHPELTAAMIATADGLNLCSLGVEQEDVSRIAALNSSLFAVSSAHSSTMLGVESSPSDTTINVSSGERHTVIVSLVQEPLGQLLVALTAEGVNLGMLVVVARDTARKVRTWLASR